MKRIISILAFCLLLIGCATAEKKHQETGAQPLSQAELEALFEGNRSASFTSPRGSGTIAYHANGKAEVDWGSGNDKGTYWIEKGTFCSKWGKIRSGKPGCFTGYKIGDNKYRFFNLDGSLNSDLTFK